MKQIKINIVALLFILPISLFAQEDSRNSEPIVTDRPDATEASATVGKGTLQFETGSIYETYEDDAIKSENYTYNTMLIRYGLLDNFEFRLGWDFVEGATRFNGNKLDDVTSGFSPLLLGMKVDITKEKGLLPEIALIGHVFPKFTAASDYRPENTGTSFRFSLANTLSEKSSLGYNIGAQWDGNSPEAVGIYTLAYGYDFTNKFGMYAELYGELPENSAPRHFWDAGITYLVNNDLQLDANIGTSITKGQDLMIGVGFSYRAIKK